MDAGWLTAGAARLAPLASPRSPTPCVLHSRTTLLCVGEGAATRKLDDAGATVCGTVRGCQVGLRTTFTKQGSERHVAKLQTLYCMDRATGRGIQSVSRVLQVAMRRRPGRLAAAAAAGEDCAELMSSELRTGMC